MLGAVGTASCTLMGVGSGCHGFVLGHGSGYGCGERLPGQPLLAALKRAFWMEVRPATLDEVQNARAAGKIQSPVRLALSMTSCITEGEMHHNFYATLERGFTPINEYLGRFGARSVVGSAPSIKNAQGTGRRYHRHQQRDFLPAGSRHRSEFGVLWDGDRDHREVRHAPHPEITYLVASTLPS